MEAVIALLLLESVINFFFSNLAQCILLKESRIVSFFLFNTQDTLRWMDDQKKDFVITKITLLEMLLLQHVTCHVGGPERQILALNSSDPTLLSFGLF